RAVDKFHGAAVLFPIPSPCGCYSPSRGAKNASISPQVQAADPCCISRPQERKSPFLRKNSISYQKSSKSNILVQEKSRAKGYIVSKAERHFQPRIIKKGKAV
ncbi:hypothetical protein, partial [Ruthenibacterium lactatiformans]|uniref:hypothetical protein n=1 Tax=Ruthenibacterium lactatiformans TaxID=1550024 RepID=UPI001967488A